MRKNALLAGALSGYEGPWVNLEAGEWLVEPNGDNYHDFHLQISGEEEVKRTFNDAILDVEVRGPARIRAVVSPDYDGPGIFLIAKQISNGEKP